MKLHRLASEGAPYFPAHQNNGWYVKFCSEQLPPGAHEIYYYARATQHGRYAALPAVAELVYGSASVSPTASANIEVTTSGSGQDTPADQSTGSVK